MLSYLAFRQVRQAKDKHSHNTSSLLAPWANAALAGGEKTSVDLRFRGAMYINFPPEEPVSVHQYLGLLHLTTTDLYDYLCFCVQGSNPILAGSEDLVWYQETNTSWLPARAHYSLVLFHSPLYESLENKWVWQTIV